MVWATLARATTLYRNDPMGPLSELARIGAAIGGATLFLFSSFGKDHQGASAAHIAANFGVICFLAMLALRAIICFLTGSAWAGFRGSRSVLIVGTGPRAIRIYRELRTKHYRSHSLLGFVDCRSKSLSPGEIESLYLGPLSKLEIILFERVVDEVIIALPARSCYAEILQVLEICTRVGVEVKYPSDILPLPQKFNKHAIQDSLPSMFVLKPAAQDSRLFIKRCIDIACSLVAVIILSPALLMIAAAVGFTSVGPVFFSQERYGLGRRRFRMYKFRTMVADAEARMNTLEALNEAQGPVFKIRNDPRVTPVGSFLRRTSLDELPQLFNVLVGHMSLVGPRPMSVRDVSLFNEAWLMRRFSVKPGMTCLWQVKGRSNTSFDRWIELDLHYIDNWSLRLDALILALTIPAVVKGSGAV
jgi:exopolysaccharide biosynthesis polyprenyl glycosylphosphotransferase